MFHIFLCFPLVFLSLLLSLCNCICSLGVCDGECGVCVHVCVLWGVCVCGHDSECSLWNPGFLSLDLRPCVCFPVRLTVSPHPCSLRPLAGSLLSWVVKCSAGWAGQEAARMEPGWGNEVIKPSLTQPGVWSSHWVHKPLCASSESLHGSR